MSDLICNTSPLQYLYQVEALDFLPQLADRVLVPPGVVRELDVGLEQGVDLPDVRSTEWIKIESPTSVSTLPLITDLGQGEVEVMALALETSGTVAVLDDGLARRMARTLRIPFTGTLGLLVDAKRIGLLPAVGPSVDRLAALGFHMDSFTRALILRAAGE